MKKKIKIICFDLDNTICKTKGNKYSDAIPIKKIIKLINFLYKKKYYIKIFTSRYMGRSNENIFKAKKMGFKTTQNQLKKWKVKYHKLILGKPSYDIYIDDKALGFSKDWNSKLLKNLDL